MKQFFLKLLNGWKAFGNLLGRIVSTIILFILYFLVIGPIAIIAYIFRRDFLFLKANRRLKTYWNPYTEKEPTIENLIKQW